MTSSCNRIIADIKPGRVRVDTLAREMGISPSSVYRMLSNSKQIEKVRTGITTKFYKRR